MSLTLNAEKQNINKIFFGDERLVVSLYQCRYSWDYDLCWQLYCDLTENFHKHREYFLGNLIFAKGTDKRSIIEIVDGQQRVIDTLSKKKTSPLNEWRSVIANKIGRKPIWMGGVNS